MIHRTFLRASCLVFFELTDEEVRQVNLVADFNNWDERATPMTKKGDKFTVAVSLDLNHDYEFRYLLDGHEWRNDERADSYAPNPFGGENSVVTTYPSAHHALEGNRTPTAAQRTVKTDTRHSPSLPERGL